MSRAIVDSDAHLLEVLAASKAKLNALNLEIQAASEDNNVYKKMSDEVGKELSMTVDRTNELKIELHGVQDKNLSLALRSGELKSTINQAKRELAVAIDDGEQKYKDITNQIKKAQEEQKRIQLQYKELQKENDKLERDKEKIMRLHESLERKAGEIEACKKELEDCQAKDSNRMQSLEDHARVMHNLSTPPS